MRLCVESLQLRRFVPHLPGLVQPAHGRVAQPHDDGEEGVQVPVVLAAVKRDVSSPVQKKTNSHTNVADLLRSDLEELLEELHPLAELRAQTHLRDHPELDFVKPPEEQVQVDRGLFQVLPPEQVIDEFELPHAEDEEEEEEKDQFDSSRCAIEQKPNTWYVGPTSCTQ